jgi:alpha-L-fucosidase
MTVNSEGIHGTRPWKIFGDGPVATAPSASRGTRFNEAGRTDLTAQELRFTTKGDTLYAFVMGWPGKQAVIKPLSTTSSLSPQKVKNVELLGYQGKVNWTQDENGLTVLLPEQKPCDYAIALKIV